MTAALEVGLCFLEGVVGRLAGEPALAGVLPSDRGLFAFLLTAVLERANRDLRFPFQFLLKRPFEVPRIGPDARGIACVFFVACGDLRGVFRVFLPVDLLRAMHTVWPVAQTSMGYPTVSWRLPICAGHAELTAAEAAGLEPGDIVLLAPEALLVLPAGDRGWQGKFGSGRFIVERYYEGRMLMEDRMAGAAAEPGPDLSGLPVRLHVVLGEKEMTLAELHALAPGAMVELDRGTSGAVDLALNGRLAGSGELVEIEGKLGVKILGWNGG